MKAFEQIEEAGKLFIKDFDLSNENDKIYYLSLFTYFSGKPTCEISPFKGLLVSGDVGTGKTLSIQIMQKIFGNINIVSTRHVIREFLQSKFNGMDVLDTYGRKSFSFNERGLLNLKKPILFCFDDLGLEEVNAQMFGNRANIFAEIILDRYELFTRYGVKTYATSNLPPAKLEELYGGRVRDRMKEMMNYVTLTGKSRRK